MWTIHDHRVRLGGWVDVSFQRTRSLSHSTTGPPQSYGAVPVAAVGHALPADVAVPLRADEGFWLALEAVGSPTAVRVAVSTDCLLDAVSGSAWSEGLRPDPQNYVVVPPQMALDGVQAGPAVARPFSVHRPDEMEGARLTVTVLAIPALGPLASKSVGLESLPQPLRSRPPAGIGGSAGGPKGLVPQRISPDPHGIAFWDVDRVQRMSVVILFPDEFTGMTGVASPVPIVEGQSFRGRRLP